MRQPGEEPFSIFRPTLHQLFLYLYRRELDKMMIGMKNLFHFLFHRKYVRLQQDCSSSFFNTNKLLLFVLLRYLETNFKLLPNPRMMVLPEWMLNLMNPCHFFLTAFPFSEERAVVLYCCAFCLNNVLFSASLETTKEGRWWRFVVCQTIHPSICFMADSVAQVSGMGRRRRIGLCFVGFLFSDAYNICPVENGKQKLEFVIQRCLFRLDCASEDE